jgi:hypothetical protein
MRTILLSLIAISVLVGCGRPSSPDGGTPIVVKATASPTPEEVGGTPIVAKSPASPTRERLSGAGGSDPKGGLGGGPGGV